MVTVYMHVCCHVHVDPPLHPKRCSDAIEPSHIFINQQIKPTSVSMLWLPLRPNGEQIQTLTCYRKAPFVKFYGVVDKMRYGVHGSSTGLDYTVAGKERRPQRREHERHLESHVSCCLRMMQSFTAHCPRVLWCTRIRNVWCSCHFETCF